MWLSVLLVILALALAYAAASYAVYAWRALSLCWYAGAPWLLPLPLETRAKPWVARLDDDMLKRCVSARSASPSNRIYFVRSRVSADGWEADVLGSSSSHYTVRVSSTPSCTCPDYMYRALQCKHLIYVKVNVLGIPPSHALVRQAAYLRHELAYILAHRKLDRSVAGRANTAVLRSFGVVEVAAPRGIGDVCAICYSAMEEGEALSDCRAECSRYVMHGSCAEQMAMYAAKEKEPMNCPCCRAPWITDANAAPVKLKGFDNYAALTGHTKARKGGRGKSVGR